MEDFTYDNRTGRGPGRTVRVLSTVLPGVARVWSQVEPYADSWRAHNLQALHQPGRRWFVLGDSLSQGIGASAFDAGWVALVGRRLADEGRELSIINLSATGARVRDVLDQQIPILHSLTPDPEDLCSVMVGSNDLFGGRALRDQLPDAYRELMAHVPPGAVVSTLTQPPDAAQRANRHVERASASGHIVMEDLRVTGPTSWRGRLASDSFHPNDAGYAALADAFAPTLNGVLSRS
ncbi:MAG: SGNH/GDSL hydrolase family protein [Ornithinimicrobium sp.]